MGSDESSKLRDLLLKSGIPLEVSVSKKLLKHGIEDWGEIYYERDGKTFSSDISAQKQFNLFNKFSILVNFVIECKYKTRDHKWCFMEFSDQHMTRGGGGNQSFSFIQPILMKKNYALKDEYCDKLNDIKYEKFRLEYVDKGVDILKDEFDPHAITEAIFQTSFASIKCHQNEIQTLMDVTPEIYYDDKCPIDTPIATITIPIIVTTAKIFVVKKDLTLEDIEKEQNITSIITEEKGVVLCNQNDSNLHDFANEILGNLSFNQELFGWCEKFGSIDAKYTTAYYQEKFHHEITTSLPHQICIINYEYLDEFFSTCTQIIETKCKEFQNKYVIKKE